MSFAVAIRQERNKPEHEKYYYHPTLIENFVDTSLLTKEGSSKLQKLILSRYLEFTENLELDVVNKVFKNIISQKYENKMNVQTKDEERILKRFIFEEETHAELAATLRRELEIESARQPIQALPKKELNSFILNLNCSTLSADEVEFLYVFSSETLISDRLKTNASSDMHQNVSNYMQMHLIEESLHRAYFLQKFKSVFPTWSDSKKQEALTTIGKCMRLFLEPDLTSLKFDIISLNEQINCLRSEIIFDPLVEAKTTLNSLKTILGDDHLSTLKKSIRGQKCTT